jgi:hypothetical protein
MKLIPVLIAVFVCASCVNQVEEPSSEHVHTNPKISSWLAKKDQLIESGKPYSLIMTSWVTPEEAERFKNANPDVIILAGVTVNWIYDNREWRQFLEIIASGDGTPRRITESMFLKRPDGSKCAFGWASQEWGHQEIYAMDCRNQEWIQLIVAAYKTILEQPQHDGVIVDMVLNVSWCPDIITNEEWAAATTEIFKEIREMADAHGKLVVFNAGKEISEIDKYEPYMDGYVMENFLGSWGADYDTGLQAADSPFLIVYAVDTDDTGVKDFKKMRLGLTLSLLHDTTYFTYDFGPRDHGQAWWVPEYIDLGAPLGDYYEKDGAYWREYEKGIVISSPHADITVEFDVLYTDVTTGITSQSFTVEKGDGRIFIKAELYFFVPECCI